MKKAILLVAIILCAGSAFAQNTGIGVPTFGSLTKSGVETINNQNLNVRVAIPFASFPGHGTTFDFSLVNDSQMWTPVSSGGTTSWTPAADPYYGTPTGAWQILNPGGSYTYTYTDSYISDCGYGDGSTGDWLYWYYDSYEDPGGTYHPFDGWVWYDTCDGSNGYSPQGFALDNSGYWGTAYDPKSPGGIGLGSGVEEPMGIIYIHRGHLGSA